MIQIGGRRDKHRNFFEVFQSARPLQGSPDCQLFLEGYDIDRLALVEQIKHG